MGRLVWNQTTLAFMKDATEYQPEYCDALWRALRSFLGAPARVCDCGCGAGFLSIRMARDCGSVEAVDISRAAVDFLTAEAARQGIANIIPVCADAAEHIPDAPYDAMVFCYFGGPDRVLPIAAAQCKGKCCIVTRNYDRHRFSAERDRFDRDTYAGVRRYFDDIGLPYTHTECDLEFGQPFRTLPDAARFFSVYSDREVLPEEIEDRLVPVERGEYRYYLPSLKKMGVICFDAKQIPKEYML